MEELLDSLPKTALSVQVGTHIEGTVVFVSEKEAILELGTKAEGVLQLRDLPEPQRKSVKVGDKIKAYVDRTESESGQVVLTYEKQIPVKNNRFDRGGFRDRNRVDLSKFAQALAAKTLLQGVVVEVNKGGLILEVDGVRGFLPGSQIGINGLGELVGQGGDIAGRNLSVNVIEIDTENNRLIFSQKGQAPKELQDKIKSMKNGQQVKGKVVAVYPFGILIDVAGDYGMVFPSDISWEPVVDPSALYKVGQEVAAVIVGVETDYGRFNLSLKQLTEDPFKKVADKFTTDDVISGVVAAVGPAGVSFTLEGGVEGFMQSSKMEAGAKYEVGSKMQILVDSVDTGKRRINLAPFLTSTKDLIYK